MKTKEERIKVLDNWKYTTNPIGSVLDMIDEDSEEMACSFAEWCLDRNIEFYDNTEKGNIYLYNGEEKTTKELYQIYLEHLNK